MVLKIKYIMFEFKIRVRYDNAEYPIFVQEFAFCPHVKNTYMTASYHQEEKLRSIKLIYSHCIETTVQSQNSDWLCFGGIDVVSVSTIT